VREKKRREKTIYIVILSNLKMDEFEKLWKENNKQEAVPEEEEEAIPNEYLLRDGLAKYKILTDLLGKYFHAKHGEPLKKIFPPSAEELEENLEEFKFHL
jgi:hypothetical protein